MTLEEHQMISDIKERLEKNAAQHNEIMERLKALEELHDAFLKVPTGSSSDVKPLLEEVRNMLKTYQRASWATRAVIWFLPALAGLGVAYTTIRGWLQ